MSNTKMFPLMSCLLLVACGVETLPVDSGPLTEDDGALLRRTTATSNWSYFGLMPRLENPKLTVSLKGHTVHVAGLLPLSFKGELPFHAVTEAAPQGRTLVHVVYPIATGDLSLFNDDGSRVKNPEAGSYTVCSGVLSAPSDHSAFGGFPFIEYVCSHTDADGRQRSGIAFHGPITAGNYEGTDYWELLRGPVSHACNRMLGEHVLELARVTGFDTGAFGTQVTVINGFDMWKGHAIDVDYAATGFQRPSNAFVFPTWQAVKKRADNTVGLEFPAWACENSRCASMPVSKLNPLVGNVTPGVTECSAGFSKMPVGVLGGTLCANATSVLGPFTQTMVSRCKATAGNVCTEAPWNKSMAQSARGAGFCPAGSRFDAVSTYCIEGETALGPFPAAVLTKCGNSCVGNRVDRFKLASLLGRW
jgi:hypothetical protein